MHNHDTNKTFMPITLALRGKMIKVTAIQTGT